MQEHVVNKCLYTFLSIMLQMCDVFWFSITFQHISFNYINFLVFNVFQHELAVISDGSFD